MEDKIVRTADGSFTIWSTEFGESYHSISAGALEESLKKFLIPSHLLFKAKKKVKILEVGFGLGYNFTVSAIHLLKTFPNIEIHYLAFEKEINPLIGKITLPDPYREFYEELKRQLLKGQTVIKISSVRLEILLGDARKRVKALDENFDAIYHDAFSPRKNPELWTLEFFAELKRLLENDGWLTTYSIALPVRRALKELGFKIFNTEPVGRRSPGTAATISAKPLEGSRLYPLSPKEEKKLEISPKAVPFRDPCLCLSRKEIMNKYLWEVEEKKKSL